MTTRRLINVLIALIVILALVRLIQLGEWGKILEVLAGCIFLIDRVFDQPSDESENE